MGLFPEVACPIVATPSHVALSKSPVLLNLTGLLEPKWQPGRQLAGSTTGALPCKAALVTFSMPACPLDVH